MRLFIGLSFPDPVLLQIASLRGSLPHIQWYNHDTYHLTLHFIGEINNYNLLNDLHLMLEKIHFPSFELTLETVNYFQSIAQTQTFWLGIRHSDSLIRLHKKIGQCLQNINIKLTKQKFVPHVTLAKGNNLDQSLIAPWLHQYNLFKIPNVKITYFSLFSSYPNKEHPFYTIEANYSLT